MRRIGVVVADDGDAVREAVVLSLSSDPRFEVLAACCSGAEAEEQVAATSPDVVLCDVRMPGGGAPLVERLVTQRDEPPVVVALSAELSTAVVSEVVAAGATGYLAKGHVGVDLGDLLLQCVQGQVVIAVPHARRVVRRLVRGPEGDSGSGRPGGGAGQPDGELEPTPVGDAGGQRPA